MSLKFSGCALAIAAILFNAAAPVQAQPLEKIRDDLRELAERLNLLPPDPRNLDLLTPQKQAQVRQLLQTKSCPGCDLTGVNLSKASLQGADLSGANLNATNLSRANLRGANLSNASLVFTRLDDANLTEANLRGARLSREGLALVKSMQGATLPYGAVIAE